MKQSKPPSRREVCVLSTFYRFGAPFAIALAMILLLTASNRAQDCATAITATIAQPVKIATSLAQGLSLLKSGDFVALVVDQQLLEADPDETERVLLHAGMATTVYMNLAISGVERVIRELRAAMHRRSRESLFARRGAEQKLRNEFKDMVTALLLSCEMALQAPTLPSAAAAKLRNVEVLAREMRAKIGEPA